VSHYHESHEIAIARRSSFLNLHVRLAGVSEFSEQVQTDGEVPGGPPRHVSVEPLGPQQLKITWQPPDRSLWNGELLGYTIGYTNLGYRYPCSPTLEPRTKRVHHPPECRATMIAMMGSAGRVSARRGAARSERQRSVLQPDRPERKLMNRKDR